jgi:hypothetical protein
MLEAAGADPVCRPLVDPEREVGRIVPSDPSSREVIAVTPRAPGHHHLAVAREPTYRNDQDASLRDT